MRLRDQPGGRFTDNGRRGIYLSSLCDERIIPLPSARKQGRKETPASCGFRLAPGRVSPVTEPRSVDFSGADPVSHDPGVFDREVEIAGTRWALVEYSPGSGREDWCDVPHAGYVVSGQITYSFEDDREPLTLSAGEGFALPPAPRHRGRNEGQEAVRLFLIDSLPGG